MGISPDAATRFREWWFRTDEIDARWAPLIIAVLVFAFVGLAFLIGALAS